MKKLGNKGISTVFGSILILILVLGVAVALFPSIYRYNYSVQEAIKVEDERVQEKIVLCALTTDNSSGTEYVSMIFVNNTGTITSRIRAIYIDNEFLCDPSDQGINPDDTYIDPQGSKWILLPPGVEYDPAAKLTVATERGIKSSEYEGVLKQSGAPPYAGWRWNLGPLMLDFNKFYYTNATTDGSYNQQWYPGWWVEIGTGHIVWNITVTNVDNRNITINRYSGFCLFPNVSPQNRRAWYLELPSFTKLIMPNETVNLIYIWDKPMSTRSQDIYNTICRCKVFLTFFGLFHELDGTTKPYAQTIPFEAVRCIPPRLQISAWPTIIPTNSSMASTITAVVYLDGYPVPDANVTFTTDLGTLSSLWAITDNDGIATVTLYPSTSPGTATVTAAWEGRSQSTQVIINAVPVASFTESAETVYTGGVISFDAGDSYDPDGFIASYFWDFGDGATTMGVTASHSYADDGIYTVTLTVTDDDGAVGSTNATKTVLNRPPVASFTENATTVLIGEVIHFDASTSYDQDGSIISYLWDFGDGTNGTGVAVDHSYADNGTYTVTLTITDDDGATDSINATKYVLNGSPIASFTKSAETVYTIPFEKNTSQRLSSMRSG